MHIFPLLFHNYPLFILPFHSFPLVFKMWMVEEEEDQYII